MASDAQPIGPLQLNPSPAVDYDAIITPIVKKLVRYGIPAAYLTEETYISMGFTKKLFASHLRIFRAFAEDGQVYDVLELGSTKRIFTSPDEASCAQFYEFLAYLRSSEGQNALFSLSRQLKLAKQGKGRLTTEQVALWSCWELASSDCSKAVKTIALEWEQRIREAEMVVRRLRTEMETALDAAKAHFEPFAHFQELPTSDLNRRCWALYLAECTRLGRRSLPLIEDSVRKAYVAFHAEVQKEHVLSFLDQQQNRQQLLDYVDGRVRGFRAQFDIRSANKYTTILAAIGRQATDPPSTEDANPVGQVHPGGQALSPPPLDPFSQVYGGDAAEAT